MIRNGLPETRNIQHGVSLVEAMVTLAILAILVAVALPSFESTISSSRITGSTNDLLSALASARSEAIRRGQRVTVCISTDGAQCAANGGWQQGWIAFTDTSRVGATASLDAGETLLRAHPAQSTGIVIQGNANLVQYVSFSSDGQARLMNGNGQTGVIRVCSTSSTLDNNNRARDLTLNMAGLLTSQAANGVASTCPAP